MAYEKTQQARIDAGTCKDCGQPRGVDGTSIRCRACAQKAAQRATDRKERIRKERIVAGLCYDCGAIRDNETGRCSSCREKQSKRPVDWQKYAESSRRSHQARRERHMSNGVCKRCGRERYYESNYCRYHFIEGIARHYSIPDTLWDDVLIKLEATNFLCFYTGIPIVPGRNACIDHLSSRSQYPDKISELDNLVWCDKWINRMKGYMSYQDFIALCQTIVKRAELRLDKSSMPVEGT